MHYRATRWENFSSCQTYINYYVLIQILTTLDLSENNIGEEGTQHLAHALQSNSVREVSSLLVSYQLLCSNTDTQNIESWEEQYWWRRGTTPGTCITEQRGERTSLLVKHISTIVFQYRYSPRWIFLRTILVMKGHNTWHMHYRATRWEKFPPY
jgi:hypothetical protein